MDKVFSSISTRFNNSKIITVIYANNILLSFHYYLVVYINSSFLGKYFDPSHINIIYIIGSALNLLILANISKLLNKIGNYKVISYFLILEIISILGMAFSESQYLIPVYFIIHSISIPIISFSLDVFLENSQTDESKTGKTRGTYLTLANITLVICPALVGLILRKYQYETVYLFSFLFIIPLYIITKRYFKDFTHPQLKHFKVKDTIAYYLKNKNLYDIFICHMLLQLFYAFMIIYSPIYLSKYIGFEWSQIGTILSIILLPFVLFELPIGKLADNKYGEKEILTIGFIIMGLATMLISLVSVKSFLIWTIILFLTRTGASFVEITSDSYFFKQVKEEDTDLISFYRITRPLSFILAPILASVIFGILDFKYIFFILGITVIVFGCHYALGLKDTK